MIGLTLAGGVSLTFPDEAIQALAEMVYERLATRDAVTALSPYMTIREAAEYLRCSRQRIDDLLSSQRLTRHKEGRRTLVRRAEIERHVGGSGQ